MVIKILKYITIGVITLLGIASVIFTAPFSTETIHVDLGAVFVGVVFLIYALFTLYASSILMLISSFWVLPRKVKWFMGVSAILYFILVLNNIIVFAGQKGEALVIFIPLVLYLFSAFRFFRKLAKGRA